MQNFHKIRWFIAAGWLVLTAGCANERGPMPAALSTKNAVVVTVSADSPVEAPTLADSLLWRLFPALSADLRRFSAEGLLDGAAWLAGLQYFQEYGWLPTFVGPRRPLPAPAEGFSTFRGVEIYRLSNGLFATGHRGVTVVGRLPLLVEDAIRQLNGGRENFGKDPFFRRHWRETSANDRRLFFRPREIETAGRATDWLARSWNEYEWVTLSLNREAERLTFTGHALQSDRPPAGGAMEIPGSLMLPDNLIAYSARRAQKRLLPAAYRPYFELWWNGELTAFQAAGAPAPVFAFRVVDRAEVRRRLGEMGDRLGLLGEEPYQLFTVRQLLDAELLAPWEPGGVRNPYFVILEDHVLFSASRTALMTCVDYQVAGRPSAFASAIWEAIHPGADGVNWLLSGVLFREEDAGPVWQLSWLTEAEEGADRIRGWAEPYHAPGLEPRFLWKASLPGEITAGPAAVADAVGKVRGYVLQDDRSRLYLLNPNGEIAWEKSLAGAVMDGFQTPLVAGQPGLIFQTHERLYALDLRGDNLDGFPVELPVPAAAAVRPVDFDDNGRPALFQPTVDGAIYGYDLEGNLLSGWRPRRDSLPLRFPIVHLQEDYQDLLLGLNRADSILLWRRSGEPPGEGRQLDTLCLSPPAALRQRPGKIVVVDAIGRATAVDVEGHFSSFAFRVGRNLHVRWMPADVTGDGRSEYVLYSERDLAGYRDGAARPLFRHRFDHPPDTVFALRAGDEGPALIGALDRSRRRLHVLNGQGRELPGFPVAASTPAVLSRQANGDWLLTVGLGRELLTYRLYSPFPADD